MCVCVYERAHVRVRQAVTGFLLSTSRFSHPLRRRERVVAGPREWKLCALKPRVFSFSSLFHCRPRLPNPTITHFSHLFALAALPDLYFFFFVLFFRAFFLLPLKGPGQAGNMSLRVSVITNFPFGRWICLWC